MLVNVTLVSYGFVMQLFKWSVSRVDFFFWLELRAQEFSEVAQSCSCLRSRAAVCSVVPWVVHRKRQINLLFLFFPE